MAVRNMAALAGVLLALAAAFFLLDRAEPPEADIREPFIWSFQPEALKSVTVTLARQGKREAWVKHDDGHWYFDQPDGPEVDGARWGLAIPLLLSGPRQTRMIAQGAGQAALQTYGLDRPRIVIALGLADGATITVDIGDSTPDGSEDYVRVEGKDTVHSVHRTFAEVVERLVREPPYPQEP